MWHRAAPTSLAVHWSYPLACWHSAVSQKPQPSGAQMLPPAQGLSAWPCKQFLMPNTRLGHRTKDVSAEKCGWDITAYIEQPQGLGVGAPH
jgi:hypothetical protein